MCRPGDELSTDNLSPNCGTATFDGDFYSFSCLPASTLNWSWFVFLTSSLPNGAGPIATITKRLTGTGGGSTEDAPTPTQQKSSIVVPTSSNAISTSDKASITSSPTLSTSNAVVNTPHKTPNIGAIVGGVLGGLALLMIFCALVVVYVRRQRKIHVEAAANVQATYEKPELDGQAVVIVAPGVVTGRGPQSNLRTSDVPASNIYKEPVVEIDGNPVR